jgi:hypothetical protein
MNFQMTLEWADNKEDLHKMDKGIVRLLMILLKILFIALGILFIVYFWNMDQKVMEWAYRRVNQIFDRKKQDIHF